MCHIPVGAKGTAELCVTDSEPDFLWVGRTPVFGHYASDNSCELCGSTGYQQMPAAVRLDIASDRVE